MSADLYSITLHENTIKPNKSIGNILSCQIYKSPNIITCRIEKLDFIILWTNLVRRGICCIILLVIVYTVVNFDFNKLPFYSTQKNIRPNSIS